MTMTTPRDLLDEIEPLLWEHEGATLVTPQFDGNPASTQPVAVLLSAAVTLTCPGCDESVPFVPVRVEGCVTADGELRVEATWSRQHGCGTWAPPVVSQTVTPDDDPTEALHLLRAQLADARFELQEKLRAQCEDDLDDWLALPTEDRWDTGSEREPGCHINDNGEPTCWTWDPTNLDDDGRDEIVVTREVAR